MCGSFVKPCKLYKSMKRMLLMCLMVMSTLFVGCETGQADQSKLRKIKLYSLETYQINYTSDNWESANPMIAAVNNTGEVTGITVGKTFIMADNRAWEVEVMPKYHGYIQPYEDWNAPRELLESYMMANKCEEVAIEDNKSLYYDEAKETAYYYTFDNAEVATTFTILLPTKNIVEFTPWLAERYYVLGEDDDVYYFISSDEKTAVMYGLYSADVALALMFPYSGDTRSIDVMREKWESLKN